MKPSGIGGQAVIEGIMMRNKDVYSVAVRKPDNEIVVIKKENKLLTQKYKILNFPIIRGVINFVESLVVGTSTLTYSASFYEDPQEQKPTHVDKFAKVVFKDKLESVVMAVTVLISIAFAVGLFMIAPYYISRTLSNYIPSKGVLNLVEGLIRVFIFIIYILLISLMKDIQRVYMYHGAEHKCINCIEHGLVLNVENVRKSSRLHKRCGTSFLFFVMFISVIFFIFIRVSNPFGQIAIRLVLVPIIAGVSYEIIRWAGKSDNIVVKIISKPGMWLQALTTREPDDDMIEVAIRAVEEVFDWKKFLEEYQDDAEKSDVGKQNEQTDLEYAVTKESKQEADHIEKSDELKALDSQGLENSEESIKPKKPRKPRKSKKIEEIEEPEVLEESEDDDDDMSRFEIIDASDDDSEDDSEDDSKLDSKLDSMLDSELGIIGKSYHCAHQELENDDESEDKEDEEDDESDDGISFIDATDEDDNIVTSDIPIFKQRKTDL